MITMRLMRWFRQSDEGDTVRAHAQRVAKEARETAKASRLAREELLQHELDIIIARKHAAAEQRKRRRLGR